MKEVAKLRRQLDLLRIHLIKEIFIILSELGRTRTKSFRFASSEDGFHLQNKDITLVQIVDELILSRGNSYEKFNINEDEPKLIANGTIISTDLLFQMFTELKITYYEKQNLR